jgi:hypothetical protein
MTLTTETTTTETTPDAATLALAAAAGAATEAARSAQADAWSAESRLEMLAREIGEMRAMNEAVHSELRTRIAQQEAELTTLRAELAELTESETEPDDGSEDGPADAETVALPPSPPNSDASEGMPPTAPAAPQRERGLLSRILLG